MDTKLKNYKYSKAVKVLAFVFASMLVYVLTLGIIFFANDSYVYTEKNGYYYYVDRIFSDHINEIIEKNEQVDSDEKLLAEENELIDREIKNLVFVIVEDGEIINQNSEMGIDEIKALENCYAISKNGVETRSEANVHFYPYFEYEILGGTEYYIGIREELIDGDIYSEYMTRYNINKSLYSKYLVMVFATMALLILMLLIFYKRIGQNSKKDEVKLSIYDRMFVEIHLTIIITMFFSIIAVAYESFENRGDIISQATIVNKYLQFEDLLSLKNILALIFSMFLVLSTCSFIKILKKAELIERISIVWFVKSLGKYTRKIARIFKLKPSIYIGIIIYGIMCFLLTVATNEEGLILIIILSIIVCYFVGKKLNSLNEIMKSTYESSHGNLEYYVDKEKLTPTMEKFFEDIESIKGSMTLAVQNEMKSERMKTELITNVSHDLRTPLTSIINYNNLMKKENITDEERKEYIEIVEKKSYILKDLIEDIIELSKATSKNIKVDLKEINLYEAISQGIGEYQDKFDDKNLTVILNSDEDISAMADYKLIGRVIDNLFENVLKYGLEGSRVYIDVDSRSNITIKNISKNSLNIDSHQLMERFTKGDQARESEGFGLGLAISSGLMESQQGNMEIVIDGDLFKVILEFKEVN